MKWLGQHIVDLIARFRGAVYLEDVDSGTIASGGNLGLDSNNKIVKATVSGGISHDGSTADGVLTYKDADEATVESYLTFANNSNISTLSLLSDQDTGDTCTISTTTHGATTITTTDDDATAAHFEVAADGNIILDAATDINLEIGDSQVVDLNNGNNTFAKFYAESGNQTFLQMFEQGGDSAADYLTIQVEEHGATIITTIDAAAAAANLAFSVDGQFSVSSTGIDISGSGTISNATWQGSSIATTYTAAKVTSIVAGEGIDVSGATGDVTVSGEDATTSNKGVASFHSDNFSVSSGAVTIKSGGIDLTDEVTGVLPSANLDADTAHLTTNQTFTGVKTFSELTIMDGDRELGASEAGFLHVDTSILTDSSTSASGTLSRFAAVNLEGPTLAAANASVTTTDAATLRIMNAVQAGDNQTITRAWSLWIDSGHARFDGSIYSGTTEAMNSSGLLTVANQTGITGVGTITSGTWQGTSIATTYTDAKVTSIVAGDGIDVDSSTGDVTITAEEASATNPGVVELATTAEADDGTDTARAVTPAGLKSHVDARYSYAYMTWSASAVPTRDGSNNPEWMLPHTSKGIYEEDWNNDSGITATSVGTTTYSLARAHAVNALVIPHTGILVGFHAHGRNDDSDLTFKAGLFHADGSTTGGANTTGIDYGNTGATHEFTLRCVATANEAEASGGADGTASDNFKGPCKLVSNTANLAVSAGDALLPAIMGNSSNSTDEIYVTMTIILKVPLTT